MPLEDMLHTSPLVEEMAILNQNRHGHTIIRLRGKRLKGNDTYSLLANENSVGSREEEFFLADGRNGYDRFHTLEPSEVYHLAVVPLASLSRESKNLEAFVSVGIQKHRLSSYRRHKAAIIPALCNAEILELMRMHELTRLYGAHKPIKDNTISLMVKHEGATRLSVIASTIPQYAISPKREIALIYECSAP